MILVLLGTQNNSFKRLLEEIDKLVEIGIIKEKIIVQAGHTKLKKYNENIEILDFMPNEKIQELTKEAKYIITHGGVASIVASIRAGKKVIAVPRLKRYNEHVNDHQLEIVELFNKKEYLIGLEDVEQLEEAYKKIESFKPIKYISDNKKLLNMVEDFIG